jgi:hypothetical protein
MMKQILENGTLNVDQDLLATHSFSVGDVIFDNLDGAGAVPNMADIFWKGVLVSMTPRVFLSLTPPLSKRERPETHEFLKRTQRPLGSPFLIFKCGIGDGETLTYGHDGRHRMFEIANKHGLDFKIPVGIFIVVDHYLLKAKDIDVTMVETISEGVTREESRQFVGGPLFDKAVWSHGSFSICENPRVQPYQDREMSERYSKTSIGMS